MTFINIRHFIVRIFQPPTGRKTTYYTSISSLFPTCFLFFKGKKENNFHVTVEKFDKPPTIGVITSSGIIRRP